MNLTPSQKIELRATINEWISINFPVHRKYLSHLPPKYQKKDGTWSIIIVSKNINDTTVTLGDLLIRDNVVIKQPEQLSIIQTIESIKDSKSSVIQDVQPLLGDSYEFRFGDGIKGAKDLDDRQIDLLLTDPPYGISKPYICEKQVPRRLRKDGTDFIMPKGNFGEWDKEIEPSEWLDIVLPKVGGWAVSFCSHSQIGEYLSIFSNHKLVAVGTMVWCKTNPVPFNHKFKPINAWEAIVIGKRPGTKFNGKMIHNVFRYKSPSPQQRIHPTQKPLELIEHFVDLFSDNQDLIFDPFAGSGTTLIAAGRKDRKVVCYENDIEVYQSACHRIINGDYFASQLFFKNLQTKC